MKLISVIVPCYNEQDTLPYFFKKMENIIHSMKSEVEFEIVFVNDGSRDHTLDFLRRISKSYEYIKYISFSRNFGKESAIYAGLEHVNGDFVVIMDADMQDPPDLIKKMYETICDDEVDCVATRRVTREGEPLIRSLCAKIFYFFINKISKVEILDGARDFRMMSRKMVQAILSMKEYNRFSKGLFAWVGFKTKWIEYVNTERIAGETKWSFWTLFLYAIQGIISFSVMPLALSSFLGFLFCTVSFGLICIIVAKTLIWGDAVAGWPSLACVILFMFGIQLFCIGILGQYIANIYLQSKNRPVYIVEETELHSKY